MHIFSHFRLNPAGRTDVVGGRMRPAGRRLPGTAVVDTGNNYTITTRHHHHNKTRPRTTFSSKLPNHNFVNIWNEIDENLKLCSSKVMFKQLLCLLTCLLSVIQFCTSAMSIALTGVVWSVSAKTCYGIVTTNNGTIKSCVSVHKCNHQLLDICSSLPN